MEGKFNFESLDKIRDPTGISLVEKDAIVQVLVDYGIPFSL